jgi:hypothetical protein
MWLNFYCKYGECGAFVPECKASPYELFSTETLELSGVLYCRLGQARFRRLTAGAQLQSSSNPYGIYGELILTVELSASTLTSSPVTTPCSMHSCHQGLVKGTRHEGVSESGGKCSPILNLSQRLMWAVSFTSRPLYILKMRSQYS